MIDDSLLNELSWQSYRDVHTDAARERLLNDHGERWFRDRGHYHTNILKAAFKLLEDKGYAVVKIGVDMARPGTDTTVEEEYSDLC